MTEKYLMMVNANRNNNKFYHMIPMGDYFEVRYGRVGQRGTTRQYPMYDFDNKYWEKIKKGYEDVTELMAENTQVSYSEEKDSEVSDLINRLQRYANNCLSDNYSVNAENVTQRMVEDAQIIIARMLKDESVHEFNWHLERLFETIPRRMGKVREYMAETPKDFGDIIEREQSLLNVMKSKVSQVKRTENGKSFLESMGLEMRLVNDEEEKNILNHLDPDTRKRYKRAFRVVNNRTEEAFNKYVEENNADSFMLYHGSRNQNWIGILSQGLQLNPKAPRTGAMFGRGIYGAPSSRKSRGYTSLTDSYWNNEHSNVGYLAVFKFASKKTKHIERHTSECVRFSKHTLGEYDCVYAHKGVSLRNDEVIVYREEQATIRYIIEVA